MSKSISTSNKNKNQGVFKNLGLYLFLGSAAISIAGGIYYLYSIWNRDNDLNEEQQIEIEEIKLKIQEKNGDICTDIAIKILAQINKRVEEIMKKTKIDIDQKRRDAIDNESLYNKLCAEYFALKEESYNKATNQILGYFNMQMSDLKEIMEQITPSEVEKKIFLYHKPTFVNIPVPNKNKTKEAFIFFGNKFVDEMSSFNLEMSKLNEISNDLTIFKMLMLKMKIDDSLYNKFGLTENQVRYLIFEYSLLEDKEIKVINDKICKYEEMLYLQ